MFDGTMRIAYQRLHNSPALLDTVVASNKHRKQCGSRPSLSIAVQFSSVPLQAEESSSPPVSNMALGSAAEGNRKLSSLLGSQANAVGVIGGFSVLSTLTFLERLAWCSTKDGEEDCPPFVVCSDPSLSRMLPVSDLRAVNWDACSTKGPVVQNLKLKREFLEKSGARCIVMPCHVSHKWHGEVSEGCSLPFLHVGDCVASELKAAKMRPLEAGSNNVKIGVLATDPSPPASLYQHKLQSQGFEVVLPDNATTDRILIPAFEALRREDKEGARNLLRIAIHILLVKAVNTVILASDELQGLLLHDDPLLQKCIDPMDSLARLTIMWAKDAAKMHGRT